MITCTLMHCMQAGQAGRQVWARSQQTTKRMDAWTAGRPAVREYLGARRIHACMLFSEGERAPGLLLPTISSSSRTEMKCRVRPLHFISVTLPLLLGCRCVMQGNLLLLTDKVVWYSTQHSTVRTCAADTAALGRQGKKLLPPSKKKYKSRFSRSQTISNFTKFIQNNINICVTI